MANEVSYTITLLNQQLQAIGLVEGPSMIEITQTINDEDWVKLEYPGEQFDLSLLQPNNIFQVTRSANDNEQTVGVMFLRRWEAPTDPEGNTTVILEGPGLNYIVSSRIVAYKSGTEGARKTAEEAGDILLELARENFGADVDLYAANRGDFSSTDRDLSSAITIGANTGIGPSADKSFAYGKLLEVMREVAGLSRELDVEDGVYFKFNLDPDGNLFFAVKAGQPGNDLRQYKTFSLEFGNLAEPNLIEDWYEAKTTAYVGGPNEGIERLVEEVTAVEYAQNTGVFTRREMFVDARQLDPEDADIADLMIAEGRAALNASKPKRRFFAKLLDVPNSRYGVDWALGDRIAISYLGNVYEGLVGKVILKFDGLEKEHIFGIFELDEVIAS